MMKENNKDNVGLFAGTKFAQVYDEARPSPPAIIKDLLFQFLEKSHPKLVLDIGCGTGLSTRYWYHKDSKVIGIDPNPDMLQIASSLSFSSFNLDPLRIQFVNSFSNNIDLPDSCADVISFATSLHWMDPESTFKEAGRLLRKGGVLISIDHDFTPIINSETEVLIKDFSIRSKQVAQKYGGVKGVVRLDEAGHAQRMKDSGVFSSVRKIAVSSVEEGDAERLKAFMQSWGHVSSAYRAGAPEEEMGLLEFYENTKKALKGETWKWFWSYTLTIAIR